LHNVVIRLEIPGFQKTSGLYFQPRRCPLNVR
jgi:hypothetical protein